MSQSDKRSLVSLLIDVNWLICCYWENSSHGLVRTVNVVDLTDFYLRKIGWCN
ncbi:hypothetical protein Goklo_015493 [Gossypium klotzschianum]|uniref:Uncharacterized protein n=1 Tax=Gossypium klotzschianum TaxID=34286 RepID=A0A7J8UB51_9ROSI|nr:hypothetical protein [Gossypium klotzschianum]